MNKVLSFLIICLFILSCVPGRTFEEQIINDIETKIPSGICKQFPKGTILTNIVVGEIVDIGLEGMTDVTYEFDYEINGKKNHEKSALLYIKSGKTYTLASMGSDCDFGM